ncbi:MAG TPA: hypothetical protein VIL20_10375, partial [Sandaracinaceae bacterium]
LTVRIGPEGLRFTSIDAPLRELRVRGHVDVRRDRRLAGTVRVAPAASWLERSALLAPFAALVDEVPVHVAGTLSAPRLRASAIEFADGALARSSLGRRVRALLDELGAPAPSIRGGARNGSASPLATDVLLDRLARDPEDAAEIFEALVQRGLAADEIEAGVAKRR